jgi:hepatocyte growth factor-regulated tyrosine kinase substrate
MDVTQNSARKCESVPKRSGTHSLHHQSHGTGNEDHRRTSSQGGSRHRSARELADAELQRAIQMSLQEANAGTGSSRPGYVPFQPSTWQSSEPPLIDRSTHPDRKSLSEEDDPELRAAIEASLREASAPKPSAPVETEIPRSEETSSSRHVGPQYLQSYSPNVAPPHPSIPKLPNYDLEPLESDAILTFSQTVEQVQARGGRDISRFPAVTELYDKANSLRPKLAMNLDDTGRKERE